MTQVYKTLGQLAPAAATQTDIYTVPAATNALLSQIVVCNFSSSVPTTFYVTVAPLGAAHATKHFLVSNCPIDANETVTIPLSAGLAATDKVRVTATLATLAFNLFGVEIT